MHGRIRGNGYATEFRADSKACLHYRLLNTCKAFTIGYLLSIFVIDLQEANVSVPLSSWYIVRFRLQQLYSQTLQKPSFPKILYHSYY